ncbi:MAG: hypothetical protein LBI84_11000 [Propionibacteriaceae bacterium]|nr:hypothetical protein [Propionibacteriaceae bacterium]
MAGDRGANSGVVKVAALSFALLLLTSCSGAVDSPGDSASPPAPTVVVTVSAVAVDFTGPWAGEFSVAYEKASDPAARFILQDGKVTAEELAEANAAFQGCLEGMGFSDVVINEDGSMAVTRPPALRDDYEAADDLVKECDAGWGDVSLLYNLVKGNPEAVDTAQIMAECLIRIGLRPAGYTAADYWFDFNGSGLDYPLGSPEDLLLGACNSDPAHAS